MTFKRTSKPTTFQNNYLIVHSYLAPVVEALDGKEHEEGVEGVEDDEGEEEGLVLVDPRAERVGLAEGDGGGEVEEGGDEGEVGGGVLHHVVLVLYLKSCKIKIMFYTST